LIPVPSARQVTRTRALLLRRTPYREADLVVQLFTESLGSVSALARSARKSQRRFGGALEPMHTLGVRLEQAPGRDLATLCEASIDTPRRHLIEDLAGLEVAGRALSWVRRAAPAHTPEPAVWQVMERFLDWLDQPDDTRSPQLHLAECGLRLLVAFGWGLDFERCVVTGAVCGPGRAAMIDPARGGLVSRAGGGARLRVTGATRARLARASAGHEPALVEADVTLALELVDSALRAHAGLE
jgi:DNA repair protein RecO (recombination protein O)